MLYFAGIQHIILTFHFICLCLLITISMTLLVIILRFATITTHLLVDCLAESNIAFVTCFTLCMSYLLFYLTVTVSLIYANIDRRCCTLCMLYLCYMMMVTVSSVSMFMFFTTFCAISPNQFFEFAIWFTMLLNVK